MFVLHLGPGTCQAIPKATGGGPEVRLKGDMIGPKNRDKWGETGADVQVDQEF